MPKSTQNILTLFFKHGGLTDCLKLTRDNRKKTLHFFGMLNIMLLVLGAKMTRGSDPTNIFQKSETKINEKPKEFALNIRCCVYRKMHAKLMNAEDVNVLVSDVFQLPTC